MTSSTSLMLHLYLAESVQEVERRYENPFLSSDFKSWRILQFKMQIVTRERLETDGISRGNTWMSFFFGGNKFLLQLSTIYFYSSC